MLPRLCSGLCSTLLSIVYVVSRTCYPRLRFFVSSLHLRLLYKDVISLGSSLLYSAKRMISKERNRLGHDSAEAIAIVKNWYGHKIFLHEYAYASELFEE